MNVKSFLIGAAIGSAMAVVVPLVVFIELEACVIWHS